MVPTCKKKKIVYRAKPGSHAWNSSFILSSSGNQDIQVIYENSKLQLGKIQDLPGNDVWKKQGRIPCREGNVFVFDTRAIQHSWVSVSEPTNSRSTGKGEDMPLTRFQVRNEFRLGDPELFRGASKDDPKAFLDGVAVAGLVGILRQLGDLADFAAEIFHDLHEQVTTTAARSHQMMTRVQRVEAALPPLEKAVFAQTSHLHFAYTPGSEWHADIQTEQNHLGHSDLPSFIMYSYEECRDPPRLFLLDKFDTAGAGACLKRYSNPSFFKTVWASSELANAEKVRREKKAQKSKKKASHQRNGEIQLDATISQCYSRIRLASPDTNGQRFAAQTASTSRIRSKSDPENGSMSLDSKPQLDFVEHVFNINSSMEHEGFEHDDLSSSKLKAQYNGTHTSILLNRRDGEDVDIDSSHKSLQRRSASGSSSVSWDEKTEIVKPTRKPCISIPQDQGQASETLPVNFEPKLVQQASSLSNIRQEDMLFDVENTPESYSGRNQFDEVVSETDNYVDALNTIESEIETDSECQTKWEVELQYDFKHQGVENGTVGMPKMAAQNSNSSDVQSPISSQSVSSESPTHAQPPKITSMASNPDTGLCGSSDQLDVSSINGFESFNGNPSSGSSIPDSQGKKVTVSSSKSQESLETSNAPSINFWTNGGLLGLEPSKPPDFSVSNGASQKPAPGIKNDEGDLTSHDAMTWPHHDESSGKSSTFVKSVEHTEQNSSIEGERDGCPDVFGPTDLSNLHLDQSVSRTSNSVQLVGRSDEHDLTDTSAATPGTELPAISNVEVQSSESGQTNNEVSSSMSGINCKPPVNGPPRKASLFHGDSSEPSITVSTNPIKWQERLRLLEQKKGQNGVGSWTSDDMTLKEQPQLGSPENLISSKSYYFSHPSPPLEHMKISFHPMNGLETSKLKLEFPDGHHFHKISQDSDSPSFQLLPKLAIPLQDIGSESDDDTFYKSSPYPSDDLLSPRSESNSEHWESAEMTGSKDHEIYDALRRIPSTSSISSSSEIEGNSNAEHGIESVDFGPALYLPSLNVTNFLMSQKEAKSDSDRKHLLDPALPYPNELPPPPPLPPLQWRMMKSAFASAEDKQHDVSNASNQLEDLQVRGPISSPQSKPPQPKPPHIEEATASPDKGMQDRQRLNGCREVSKAANDEVVDEREDFLQQIRAKSFSLRPTLATRPSFTPRPTTNIKVVAILEKANAIRQACVGSDDDVGDDENWSDG
ncbi:protein SCAR3-like isoform X2 [Magnolia sinica]|uniref:protein SCAR3-like isoform X2 n=1 Tax=Magnolia sinica TaxID=86752 RepID=UPI00265A2A75|nr:protein SCAR3-like isoform X2 [Magnolia sinica]